MTMYYLYFQYGCTTELLLGKSENLEKLEKRKKQESKHFPSDELEIVYFSESGEIHYA